MRSETLSKVLYPNDEPEAGMRLRLAQQYFFVSCSLQDMLRLPERFHNVTNGVAPRRFMMLSNPGLATLLDETVGEGWVTDLARLRKLEEHADDIAFQERWRHVKQANKEALAERIRGATGVIVDPCALFDIQVKRIHEYKRQHLNALFIVTLYQRLRRNPQLALAPRCFVFGGKAAPGYHFRGICRSGPPSFFMNTTAPTINRPSGPSREAVCPRV